MNYSKYFNKFNFFNKDYKNISISGSTENLLGSSSSSIENITNLNQSIKTLINKNKINSTESIEFLDFTSAIELEDTNNNIEEFANFDDTIFINNSNFIESDENESINIVTDIVDNIVNDIVTDIVDNIVNDIIITNEVQSTIGYLIDYCENYYKEYKYELIGNITNLLYQENNIVYVVRVNEPEQFKQFIINTYNIIGLEGIFYWNEKSILKLNDKVLVECTYIGHSCKYKLNKIIKKL